MIEIPNDVVQWLRTVFFGCNIRVTNHIGNNPNAPEEWLDLSWIEYLTHFATPYQLPSGWLVKLEAHYLGGLRHFRSWEIADIGILIFIRHKGETLRNKVALLQSKRLYPTNERVREELRVDYEIGFARLADQEGKTTSFVPARFEFTEDCVYGALQKGSDQYKAIEEYSIEHETWVYYQFYNPPYIPFVRDVPILGYVDYSDKINLGIRIASCSDVHRVLQSKGIGQSPILRELIPLPGRRGLALEDFVTALLLCHEGAAFESVSQPSIEGLFYRRSGPISAAIAISIEAT